MLHLLPELAEHQTALTDASWTGGIHHVVYLLTLAGLLTFYAFERALRTNETRTPMPHPDKGGEADDYDKENGEEGAHAIYRLHLVLFSIYSLIVGNVIAESTGGRELALFAVAMVLHFVVVDKALAETFERGWTHVGRWVMAASVLIGWGLGMAVELPHQVVACVMAFLGGAVILNVLKEELPEEREGRLGAFVAGAVGYALLLVWL